MKKTILLLILLLFMTSATLFGQDSLTHKNIIKISVLSLVANAKVQYERVISKRFSLDISASYYYLNPMTGIKFEPAFRYYFKHHAPTGWYVEPKFLIGRFNTKEFFNSVLYTYNDKDSLINQEALGESKKDLSFTPVGGALKFGIQKYFGRKQRFVFDYNLGVQYFPYNFPRKETQTQYSDGSGNETIIVTSYGSQRDAPPTNYLFWSFIGAGSFLYTNVSIGYNF